MAEPGAVKGDDAVVGGRDIDHAARFKILDHAAIAVKQDERFALSPLDVVQAHTVDFDELPPRGFAFVCLLGR